MEILLVDDGPMLRLMYSEVLREAGYSVSDANSADEALLRLEGGCVVNVVVTDVHMPGKIDGFEFARVICARWPGIGVVIMSGRLHPSEDDLPDESQFLSKPVAPELLTSAVRDVALRHHWSAS